MMKPKLADLVTRIILTHEKALSQYDPMFGHGTKIADYMNELDDLLLVENCYSINAIYASQLIIEDNAFELCWLLEHGLYDKLFVEQQSELLAYPSVDVLEREGTRILGHPSLSTIDIVPSQDLNEEIPDNLRTLPKLIDRKKLSTGEEKNYHLNMDMWGSYVNDYKEKTYTLESVDSGNQFIRKAIESAYTNFSDYFFDEITEKQILARILSEMTPAILAYCHQRSSYLELINIERTVLEAIAAPSKLLDGEYVKTDLSALTLNELRSLVHDKLLSDSSSLFNCFQEGVD